MAPKKKARVSKNTISTNKKAHITILVIGNQGSGKSTTVGHLLYKLGEVNKSKFEMIEKQAAEMHKASFKYAWLLDRLKTERDSCRTIDLSWSKFETSRYKCTVWDAPGHLKYIKNMITGTSLADCAILVIDSTFPAFEDGMHDGQTREHTLIASALGVKEMICCINKMDATKYSEERYQEIVGYLDTFFTTVGYLKVSCIPISAFDGENMIKSSRCLRWYKGPTLIEAINQVNEPKRPSDKPLRIPILDVYKIDGIGTVAVGRVESGEIKQGMEVVFAPADRTSNVKSVQMHYKGLPQASAGDCVGFNVDVDVKDLKRGDVAFDANNVPPIVIDVGALSPSYHQGLVCHVIVLNHPGKIRRGYEPTVYCHAFHTRVLFAELLDKIDKSFHKLERKPEFLENGDAGRVLMVPKKPMVCETFEDCPPLGRFIVRDMGQTVAVAVILFATPVSVS